MFTSPQPLIDISPTSSTAAALPLDAQSLAPHLLSLPTLMRELNLQSRPAWLLRVLMNHLESKRQAKGLGWSRPWNKIGLNVFRTHVQYTDTDTAYFEALESILKPLLARVPLEHHTFAEDLLNDPARMAFTFYHNRQDGDRQYEGLTLSLGRRVKGDPSKRDRLDLILEDLRVDGQVDGLLDRVRLYICPWSAYKNTDRPFHLLDLSPPAPADVSQFQSLYQNCIQHYHDWKTDDSRQWTHWSANYIDYFGPRSFIPVGTSFN